MPKRTLFFHISPILRQFTDLPLSLSMLKNFTSNSWIFICLTVYKLLEDKDMYKLNVTTQFSAAHKLNGYDGACRNLHGHNWNVRVGIECQQTDEIGLTIDFGIVKKNLNQIIGKLDHVFLNDLSIFSELNPTSENIAQFIFLQMKELTTQKNCQIKDVEVWESDKSSIVYCE